MYAISPDFFPMLGVRPLLGRLYTPEEYHIDGGNLVISYRFWKRQLGGDPHVIGRSLTMQGVPLPVIGVMPDLPDCIRRPMSGQDRSRTGVHALAAE